MTLRDISIALAPGVPEWPGDTPFSCGWAWRIADGASVNLSAFTTSPHCGTHADAPLHVHDGWAAADAMPLEVFAGTARVLTVDPAPRTLETRDLPALGVGRIERLLLRTSCSIAGGTFPAAWPVLSLDAVAALHGARTAAARRRRAQRGRAREQVARRAPSALRRQSVHS